MSTTTVATVNETSFAVAYADATTLVLDALTQVGPARFRNFYRADRRLATAALYADTAAETALVKQLQATLKLYNQRGWDRI